MSPFRKSFSRHCEPHRPERMLAILERHYASNLFPSDRGSPSIWLSLQLWNAGIAPRSSGYGAVRPWHASVRWRGAGQPTEGFAGVEAKSFPDRMRQVLDTVDYVRRINRLTGDVSPLSRPEFPHDVAQNGSRHHHELTGRAAKDQVSSDLVGETILLSMQSAMYYGLDGVAARVWELLGQPTRVKDLCDVMLTEFDVGPDRCEAELLDFLRELAARILIEVGDGAGPSS